MSFMTCCVVDCFVSLRDGIPLHRFPNPNSDQERFQAWIMNIGGNIGTLERTYVYNNRRVCHRHFDPMYHGTKSRLSKMAVPTLHLSGLMAECSKMELKTSSTNLTANTSCYLQSEITIAHASNIPYSQTQSKIQSREPVSMPEQEIQLKKLIMALKKQVARNKVAKNSFKQRLVLAKKMMKTDAMKHISEKISKQTKTFLEMQVKGAGKKEKGHRFTLQEKILALTLYKPSPKAYRVLSKICILPQRKTLNNLLKKIQLQPGINEILFTDIKRRVSKLPMHHRYCILIFDEMSITPGLTYDQKNDEIVGFIDDGEEKKKEFTDHVLVFMVRGVIKKFKQPVAYAFCKNATKSCNLVHQIQNVLIKLQDTGLVVLATVCDQARTNMCAINILFEKTKREYVKKGKEWKGGFFEINSKKIVPLFDPPHLLKGVRNNLINKDLKYVSKNKECTAKWQHIIDLYNRSPGYKGKRLVPKLTAQHVLPQLIPKMRVKHCTQVFSNSVGVALGFMADAGKLPEGSQETADILLFFDNLFDSVNGSSTKERGKIYRTAVTPRSPHQKLWNKSIPLLKSMRFVKNNKVTVVPSIKNWVKTIEGFKLILNELYKCGLTSIFLRNFNQDPIENFFGAIRAHGAQNIKPYAGAFTASFKTLLINNMSSVHSVGANCAKDDNSCLLQSLEGFFSSSSECSITNKENIEVMAEHLLIEEVDVTQLITSQHVIDIERCAALGYCCGWLVSKARRIYKNCAECKNNLESSLAEDFHNYIKVCEYSDKSWLCYPTKEVFYCFVQIENITRTVLQTCCYKRNMLQYIKLLCSVHLDISFSKCNLHKDLVTDFLLQKSIIFNIFTWCKHINKILSGREINCDCGDPMQKAAMNYHIKNKFKNKKNC